MPPRTLRLLVVAGARPNFMKVAPIIKAAQAHNHARREGEPFLECKLVHTGQHYDQKMSDVFFQELSIPAPDFNLGVGSGSHAVQTAQIMTAFEPVLLTAFSASSPLAPRPLSPDPYPSRFAPASCGPVGPSSYGHVVPSSCSPVVSTLPDWVVVVGDVNSTMACTLVCSKLGIKVVHVEAGLRSFDRTMPEEVNRIVTDALADLLLTPSADADDNLKREGIPADKISLVGNVMIDTLVANLAKVRQNPILQELGLAKKSFAYVTLHRPSNVDCRESLSAIISELKSLAAKLPVVFPIHPRTRQRLTDFGLCSSISSPVVSSPVVSSSLLLLDPIGYLDSLTLTRAARLVLTDSGGLQEESTFFRTPCLTLRPNTERPVTVTLGSNRLTDAQRLSADIDQVLSGAMETGQVPPFWDGCASERIINALTQRS